VVVVVDSVVDFGDGVEAGIGDSVVSEVTLTVCLLGKGPSGAAIRTAGVGAGVGDIVGSSVGDIVGAGVGAVVGVSVVDEVILTVFLLGRVCLGAEIGTAANDLNVSSSSIISLSESSPTAVTSNSGVKSGSIGMNVVTWISWDSVVGCCVVAFVVVVDVVVVTGGAVALGGAAPASLFSLVVAVQLHRLASKRIKVNLIMINLETCIQPS